jgi:hypothetical protein
VLRYTFSITAETDAMMGQLGEIMRRQNGPHSLSSGVVFIVVLWIMSLVSQQEAQSDFFGQSIWSCVFKRINDSVRYIVSG